MAEMNSNTSQSDSTYAWLLFIMHVISLGQRKYSTFTIKSKNLKVYKLVIDDKKS